MSKGKELLVHALDRLKHINYEDDHLTNDLIQTIQKYLTQPEQEPVAWMNDSGSCFLSDGNKYSENWTPLYTSPPKREPLSEAEIFNAWIPSKATPCVHSFKAGVKFAEKEHGIGVDYE
jgi:hypothetical protein